MTSASLEFPGEGEREEEETEKSRKSTALTVLTGHKASTCTLSTIHVCTQVNDRTVMDSLF